MRKKKYILFFIIVIIFFLIFILAMNGNKIQKDKVQENNIADISKYKDILLWLEECSKGETIEFILPKNNTRQDYNTYYGNMICLLLNGKENEKIVINAIDEIISEEDFMTRSGNDVFEGIERCYYFDQLAYSYNKEYYNYNIDKYVNKLLIDTYNEGGYFISEEFIDYFEGMTIEEVFTIKLSQTMEMLYLCNRYDKLELIDIEAICKWLMDSNNSTCNVIDKFYIYQSLKYLEVDAKYKNNIDISKCEVDLDNIMEIDYYVRVHNNLDKQMPEDNIFIFETVVCNNLKNCKMSDLKNMFFLLDIAKQLDFNVTEQEEEIKRILSIYQYDNGMFPLITPYSLDNKQLLMFYKMSSIIGNDNNLKIISELINHDFTNQDAVDLSAYAYFANILDLDMVEIKQEIKSQSLKCSLNDENRIKYMLDAMNYLKIRDKKKYLDEKINDYIEFLNTNEFLDYSLFDIILLNGAVEAGLIKSNEILILNLLRFDEYEEEEVIPISIYYKYKLLMRIEGNINLDKVQKQIDKFRCNGGYKLLESDYFLDLQVTYMLLDLQAELDNYESNVKK